MGLSGLSGMAGLSAIAGGEDLFVPVAVTGQTLLAREHFLSADVGDSLSSGNPGLLFDTIHAGNLWCGLDRGCRGKKADGTVNQVRSSGSANRFTSAEEASSTVMFRGSRLVPTLGSVTHYGLGGWFRFMGPDTTSYIGTNRRLITLTNNVDGAVGTNGLRGIIAVHASSKLKLYGGQLGSATQNVANLPLNEPIWIQFSWRWASSGTAWDLRGHYMLRGGGPTLTQFYQETFSYAYNAGMRINLEQMLIANQGGPVFTIAGLSLFQFADWTAATTYPTDLEQPLEQVKTYTVNSSTGSDEVVCGPWASIDGVVANGFYKNVLLTPPGGVYLKKAASQVQFSDIASANGADSIALDIAANTTKYVGDTITVNNAGSRYEGTLQLFLSFLPGTVLRSGDGATVTMDRSLTGGWTDLTGGAWQIDDTVNARAGVWQEYQGTLYALYPIRRTNAGVALSRVQSTPGSYCTEGGTVIVNPLDLGAGSDPSHYSWRAWSGVGSGSLYAYIYAAYNLIEGINFEGGIEYGVDQAGPDVNSSLASLAAHPQVYIDLDRGAQITTLKNCTFRRGGKHHSLLSGNSGQALVLYQTCQWSHGPVAANGSFTGFNYGDWYNHTSFCGSTSSNLSIYEYFLGGGDPGGQEAVAGAATSQANSIPGYYSHTAAAGTGQFRRTTFDGVTWTITPHTEAEHTEVVTK